MKKIYFILFLLTANHAAFADDMMMTSTASGIYDAGNTEDKTVNFLIKDMYCYDKKGVRLFHKDEISPEDNGGECFVTKKEAETKYAIKKDKDMESFKIALFFVFLFFVAMFLSL